MYVCVNMYMQTYIQAPICKSSLSKTITMFFLWILCETYMHRWNYICTNDRNIEKQRVLINTGVKIKKWDMRRYEKICSITHKFYMKTLYYLLLFKWIYIRPIWWLIILILNYIFSRIKLIYKNLKCFYQL